LSGLCVKCHEKDFAFGKIKFFFFFSGESSLGSLPSLSTNSSLLFTTGSSGAKQRKSYKMGPGFGSNRLQPKPEASDEG